MKLEQMQYYRKKAGYSYKKLAELSGVPLSTVQKIFGGVTRQPHYDTLRAIENVLYPKEVQSKHQVMERAAYMADFHPDFSDRRHTLEDYYALPEDRRVELINGRFYDMAAPGIPHQIMALKLYSKLEHYITEHSGKCIPFTAPTDVQLDEDEYTMVQPDVFVVCDKRKLTSQCVKGAPDFIIEVLSESTKKKDMTKKLSKYVDAGVREYWMVDLKKHRVLVYLMEEDEFQLSIYGIKDKIPVAIYEGELQIDFAEIMKSMTQLDVEEKS